MAGTNPEMQNENRDLNQTLEKITVENGMNLDDSEKKWMKQALAGIADGLPGNKMNENGKLTTQELQSAMTQRVEKDASSSSDIVNNPDVQKIKSEMVARIQGSQSNPAQLLKEYAEMRWMLDGAIGANEKSQSKSFEDFQKITKENEKNDYLKNLNFAELGKIFREGINSSQKQSQESRLKKLEKLPPDWQPAWNPKKTEQANAELKNLGNYI